MVDMSKMTTVYLFKGDSLEEAGHWRIVIRLCRLVGH